jgi:hypothetical protein
VLSALKARYLWLIAGLAFATAADAEILKGYPDAIVCRVADAKVVVYIAGVKDDGSAIYRTSTDIYATITSDHVFHHEGAKDCDGKSIEQLEKAGQTRQFQ